MQYSLLSRFRGALLGAAVGEILGAQYQSQLDRGVNPFWLDVDQWGFNQVAAVPQLGQTSPTGFGRMTVHIAKSLIQQGEFCPQNQPPPTLALPHLTPDSGESTIAVLPIMLFFHDNQLKLRSHLQKSTLVSKTGHYTLAVNHAIALALVEKLDPSTLISQALSHLEKNYSESLEGYAQGDLVHANAELSDSYNYIYHQLAEVQRSIEQGIGLQEVTAQLLKTSLQASGTDFLEDTKSEKSAKQTHQRVDSSLMAMATSFSLAFYSFLSTPQDFRLTVIRAAQLNFQPQVVCALAGALSGAYNSLTGIPTTWQTKLSCTEQAQSSSLLTKLWGVNSEELLQLGDQLLAAWAGVYRPTQFSTSANQVSVAAPNVIRPR